MTDIFTARDRLVRAIMAEMDMNADLNERIAAAETRALGSGADVEYDEDAIHAATTEVVEAEIAYWEIARGRKWPA